MTTLHLLRTSGFSSPELLDCIYTLNAKDDLVLIDDGCYNINHPALEKAQTLLSQPIKVVREHANARGIDLSSLFTAIDLSDTLDMAFLHSKTITWQ